MKFFIFCALGFISWPILEYILHRFLGHDFKLKTEFKKQHTRHHVETNYFAPTLYKILAAIPVSLFFFFTVGFLSTSSVSGLLFTLGFASMYTLYEWSHWNFHANPPKTKLGLILRKHHFAHHFHNPKSNFGVTTRIIDKLIGTYVSPEIIKVPKNIQLKWLCTKELNKVDQEFEKDFVIR